MSLARRPHLWLLIGILAGVGAGCMPAITPLYHDYRIPPATALPGDSLRVRIARALEQAGWTPTETADGHTLATEPRTLQRWGLYRITVYLEVAPIGDDYVRVFFHPYRQYVTGGRSKIPYLSRRLRRMLIPPLDEHFQAAGLRLVAPRLDDERRR